jgi:hypothetical protein
MWTAEAPRRRSRIFLLHPVGLTWWSDAAPRLQAVPSTAIGTSPLGIGDFTEERGDRDDVVYGDLTDRSPSRYGDPRSTAVTTGNGTILRREGRRGSCIHLGDVKAPRATRRKARQGDLALVDCLMTLMEAGIRW